MLGRRGFTLIEVVLALMILGLLAGVLVPQLISRLRDGEITSLAGNLSAIANAAAAYRADLGRYPRFISMLTSPTGTHQDICNLSIPSVTELWRGPYLSREVTTAGISIGSSVISNTLTRDPPSSVMIIAFASLVISVSDVEVAVATAINRDFDGDGSLTAGSVRWSAGSVPNRGTLTYRIPIRGC